MLGRAVQPQACPDSFFCVQYAFDMFCILPNKVSICKG